MKAYIREVFKEDPYTAVEVARMESTFQMIQSNHVYTAKNVPPGYKVGDREQSFCVFQIHEPAHRETIERLGLQDFKTNVESCVKMAYVIYKNKGSFSDWSVYKTILAMR